MKRFSSCLLALLALGAFTGCHRGTPSEHKAATEKSWHVRGVVVSTDATKGTVTLDSEAIPGYMEAMIMPYTLKNPGIISELHPGDTITADLFTSNAQSALDHIVVVGQAKVDYKPRVQYKPLNPGDAVPDFKLLNQSGKLIHIGQFRGKVLLVTFIYTRCPLADYCPRMSRNFAQLDKLSPPTPRSTPERTSSASVSIPNTTPPPCCAAMEVPTPATTPRKSSLIGILPLRRKKSFPLC